MGIPSFLTSCNTPSIHQSLGLTTLLIPSRGVLDSSGYFTIVHSSYVPFQSQPRCRYRPWLFLIPQTPFSCTEQYILRKTFLSKAQSCSYQIAFMAVFRFRTSEQVLQGFGILYPDFRLTSKQS